jgi:hypothetical protein
MSVDERPATAEDVSAATMHDSPNRAGCWLPSPQNDPHCEISESVSGPARITHYYSLGPVRQRK